MELQAEHQKLILNNISFLVDKTQNIDDLFLFLQQRGAITKSEKEFIVTNGGNNRQKHLNDLYLLISNKPPAMYKRLLDALKVSGNWHVSEKLQHSGTKREQINMFDENENQQLDGDNSVTSVKAQRQLFEKDVKPKVMNGEVQQEEVSQVKSIRNMFQKSISVDDAPKDAPKEKQPKPWSKVSNAWAEAQARAANENDSISNNTPPNSPTERKQKRSVTFSMSTELNNPEDKFTATATEDAANHAHVPVPAPRPRTMASSHQQSEALQQYVLMIQEAESYITSKIESISEFSELNKAEAELARRVDDILYRGTDLVAKGEATAVEMNPLMGSLNGKSGQLWAKLRLLRVELGAKMELFEFTGKEDEQRTLFMGIERNIERSLKIIHINNVTIAGPKFVENIRNCGNMEDIRLDQVLIQGSFQGRAFFPKLKNFYLDQVGVKVGNVRDHVVTTNPKEFLFFDREYGKEWPVDNVWSLGINIKLIINGTIILHVDHDTNHLTSMLKETDALLKNSGHVTSLAINQCRVSHLNLPTGLKSINLYQCDGLYLSTFLSQCINLEDIRVWGGVDKKALHLSALPETLKKAAFAYVDVVNSRGSALELEEFASYRCKWVEGTEQDNSDDAYGQMEFGQLAVNARRLAIVGGQVGFRGNPTLLKTLRGVYTDWIYFSNFDWRDKFVEKAEMKDFTKAAGLRGNESNFLLEKAAGDYEMWFGKEVEQQQKSQLEFEHFNWQQLWTSVQAAPGGLD